MKDINLVALKATHSAGLLGIGKGLEKEAVRENWMAHLSGRLTGRLMHVLMETLMVLHIDHKYQDSDDVPPQLNICNKNPLVIPNCIFSSATYNGLM